MPERRQEMAGSGLRPNTASFNILLGGGARVGLSSGERSIAILNRSEGLQGSFEIPGMEVPLANSGPERLNAFAASSPARCRSGPG